MKRTGYAAGGPIPLSYSVSNPPGGSYAGMPAWAPPSGGGVPSTGGDFGSSGGEGGSEGGGGGGEGGSAATGYQRGGVVRRRRRRGAVGRAGGPPVKSVRRRRARPTGYADGGEVDPLLMSVSLDSRSKNPEHYEEDEEALSTRPGGAPKAPDEFGSDETGYQAGGEVEDDEEQDPPDMLPETLPDIPPEPEEPIPPQEPDDTSEEPPINLGGKESDEPSEQQQSGEQEPDEEQQDAGEGEGGEGGEGGGGGQGGGGEPQQTGYNKPEEAQQPQQTGYNQQQQQDPGQAALKEVLDFTRQKLGVGGEQQAPAQRTADTAPTDISSARRAPSQIAAASEAAAQAPPAAGAAPDEGETPSPAPQQQAAEPAAPAGGPTLPRATATRASTPTASGPGNKQAIQQYMAGADGYTPEQMTQLLDRTNQTQPNLDQSGAIRTAFQNLVSKNDIDGASKFLQALRPSYDNVRAVMIAAVSQGQYDKAMQLAEQMNNLIPNGQQLKMGQGPDGRIIAAIRPEDGGQGRAYAMTPQQFGTYATGALSLFDHTAEQGLDKNFTLLTGQPGQPVPQGGPQQAFGPQFAQANTGTMSDAMPTGYRQMAANRGGVYEQHPGQGEAGFRRQIESTGDTWADYQRRNNMRPDPAYGQRPERGGGVQEMRPGISEAEFRRRIESTGDTWADYQRRNHFAPDPNYGLTPGAATPRRAAPAPAPTAAGIIPYSANIPSSRTNLNIPIPATGAAPAPTPRAPPATTGQATPARPSAPAAPPAPAAPAAPPVRPAAPPAPTAAGADETFAPRPAARPAAPPAQAPLTGESGIGDLAGAAFSKWANQGPQAGPAPIPKLWNQFQDFLKTQPQAGPAPIPEVYGQLKQGLANYANPPGTPAATPAAPTAPGPQSAAPDATATAQNINPRTRVDAGNLPGNQVGQPAQPRTGQQPADLNALGQQALDAQTRAAAQSPALPGFKFDPYTGRPINPEQGPAQQGPTQQPGPPAQQGPAQQPGPPAQQAPAQQGPAQRIEQAPQGYPQVQLPPKPTLQLPQRPAQPSRREESAADQALHLAPWSNQHNVRSRIAGQILLQQRREAENRQKQQYQQTPADRAAIVQYQEEMRNWRAGQLSMDRNLQMQITRDNNFLNNATRNMTSARRGEVQDMLNRHNNWMRDPQGGQTGIPYEKGNPEFTAHDQRIRQELIKNGMDLGYFNQPMTPPLGGYPNGPPPHAPVPVAPTPGVKPGASQGDRYNQVYKSDPKDIDSPPPGVTLQPGEEWMRGHRKDGTSTGNWQLRKSQPAPATQ